jgi:hypothetical protein
MVIGFQSKSHTQTSLEPTGKTRSTRDGQAFLEQHLCCSLGLVRRLHLDAISESERLLHSGTRSSRQHFRFDTRFGWHPEHQHTLVALAIDAKVVAKVYKAETRLRANESALDKLVMRCALGTGVSQFQCVHLAASEAICNPALIGLATFELGKGGNDLIVNVHRDGARHFEFEIDCCCFEVEVIVVVWLV